MTIKLGVREGALSAVVFSAAKEVGWVPTPDSPVMQTAGWLHLPWPTILAGGESAMPVARRRTIRPSSPSRLL